MKRSLLALFFCVSLVSSLQGQTVTVNEVVQIALQKNYDVRILQNSAALANNDNRGVRALEA